MRSARGFGGARRGRTMRAACAVRLFESLEQRLHLAAVMWDGGAGTDSWHDALNWDNDAVPTAADDVTIPDTALAEVRVFGSAEARSLTLDGELRIAGDSLTLSAGAAVHGTLTIGDGLWHSYLRFDGVATQGVSGTGIIQFHSSPNGFDQRLIVQAGVTLTTSGVTVRGGFGSLDAQAAGASFVNGGTIAADLPGGTLTLLGTFLETTGEIEIDGSSALMVSGTLSGATITGQPGARIGGSNFSSCEFIGDLYIGQGFDLTVSDSLTVNGTLTIGDGVWHSYLYFDIAASQSLAGSGTVRFHDQPNSFDQRIVVQQGITLTTSGVTVRGGFGSLDAQAAGALFVNGGTIAADLPGGTLTLLGSFAGSTGEIEIGSSSALMVSGTLSGATITGQPGARIGGSNFSGCSFNGDLYIGQGSDLTVSDSLTVNGTLTIGDGVWHSYLYFDVAASQSLAGSGTVRFHDQPNSFDQRIIVQPGVTLTTSPGLTVRGGFGTIDAQGAGASFVNVGTIAADLPGGTLMMVGAFQNWSGIITVGSSSAIVLSGVLTGGVINGQAGSRASGGVFSGITVTGNVTIDNALSWTVSNGMTVNGTLTIGGGTTNGRLQFVGSAQTLGGSGEVVFDRLADEIHTAIEVASGVELTIGSNLTIRGGNGYLLATAVGASIINLGTIRSDQSGRYISLFSQGGSGIFNQGFVQAIDGGLLWFSGNFMNSAGVVDIRDGGVAIVSQSEIIGGTITGTGGGLLYNNAGNGSLRGVTVNGHIRVPAGTQIATLAGLTVNGSVTVTGQLLFNSGGVQTLGGTGEVIFDTAAGAKLVRVNAGSLVVGPDITIRGGEGGINSAGTSSQVVIDGTIFADTAGATITLSGVAAFVIAGHLQAAADATVSLSVAMTHQPGSTYTGAGTVRFDSGTHTFETGTHTLDSRVSVHTILTGPGNLVFTSAVTWDNWATGNGTLTFASTATVNHIRGGYHRNTDNYGNFFWNNNDIELIGGRTFTNHVGAHFEFAVPLPRPHSYIYLNPGVATFINEGTFIKSGSTSLSVPSQAGQFDFINRGVVSHNFGVNTWGRVRAFINEADAVMAVIAGSMHLPNASNMGTFSVAAGAQLTLPQLPAQVVGNALVGGTWIVGGTLTFPAGTNLFSIEPGASFTLDGPNANVGGALNGLTTNNGTLTIRDPGVFPFNPAGGVFFNNGTLALTGTGTFDIPPSITFNNGPAGTGGVIRVGSNLRGPGPIIIDDPINGGTLDIFGTVTFNQSFDIFAVINLHPGGTLNGDGDITARAAFNWFGGTQSGTGSTTAAAQLTLHGSDVMTLSRVASNTFAGNWTGGCLLLAGGQFVNSTGAAFVVTGTVEVLSDEVGGEQFVNEGSLVFEQGSESTFGDNLAVTSTPGSETVYRAQVSYADDHTFDGNIAVELTGVLTAAGNLVFLAGFELRLGGEITGAGTITFGGLFRWINGSMTGTGTTVVEEEAIFELSGGDKLLARTLDNFSLAGNWTGGCILMSDGIFNNRATASLNIFADPQIDVVDAGGVNEFNNDGLITVHTGEFVIGVPGTNNGTIIVIPPDTLVFAAAWFHMPGSSLEGPGGVRFAGGQHTIPAGGLNITGPITITGGALVLAAMFMPNYNAGTFTFTGGNWAVSGDGQLFLNGAEIRVIGPGTTFAIGGTGVIGALDTLSRVDGTLSLADGAVFTSNPNGVGGVFINNGLVSVGTGATFAPVLYQQTAAGVLQTRLTGLGAAERGYINITGHAALSGTLRIEHVEGFEVALGQQITFFSAAASDGWFDDISVGDPGAGLHVVLGELEGQILFTITHAGDWNLDFVRDVQDIFDFLTDWFNDEGDYNGDGTHEVADIFAFLTAWFTG